MPQLITTISSKIICALILALAPNISFGQNSHDLSELQGNECMGTDNPVSCLENMIVALNHDMAFYQDRDKNSLLISKAEFIGQLAVIYLKEDNLAQGFSYFEKGLAYIENMDADAVASSVRVADIQQIIIEKAKFYCGKMARGSAMYEKCNCDAYMENLTPISYERVQNAKQQAVTLEQALNSTVTTYDEQVHGNIQNYILASIKRFIEEKPLNAAFTQKQLSDLCDLKVEHSLINDKLRRECLLLSSYHARTSGEHMMGLASFMRFPDEMLNLTLNIKLAIEPSDKVSYSLEGDTYFVTYKAH